MNKLWGSRLEEHWGYHSPLPLLERRDGRVLMVWVTGGSSRLPWESTYCVPDTETGAGVGPRSHRPGPEGWAPSVGCSPARRGE